MQGIPWQSSGLDSVLPLQGGLGSIPGWGTKILQAATWLSQNK